MPIETGLWRIKDAGLVEAQRVKLESEADLHKWIEANPRLISSDLLIIGSRVRTAHEGEVDLLGVDSFGAVHVIELKRDKTPREVVAQTLDYASWVVNLTSDDLDDICQGYKNVDLATAYREHFGLVLPETLNEEHSMTIVAASLDPASERIVQYLQQYHGVSINAVFFTVFNDEGGRTITRAWLIDPEKVSARSEERAERKERGEWTGYYFVNVGVGKESNRSWEDNRRFGFVSAGDGVRFRRFMQKLRPGDEIFAYAKGHGYVGYGIVTAEAVMARDFCLPNGDLILEQDLKGSDLRNNVDDEDRAEYVVGVDWKKTVSLDEAKTQHGIFRIQQVVNKIYDAATVDFLKRQFEIT